MTAPSSHRDVRSSACPRGYTLVEVLIVVAIIGIAGAVVVPHMLTAGELGIQAAARMVIADLLYAQNDAIAQQAPRRVTFDVVNNRYQITDTNDQVLHVPWRGGSGANYVVDLGNDDRFRGVRITAADFEGSPTVEFDELGAPATGGSITLDFEGTQYRITVAKFTGRVTVERI